MECKFRILLITLLLWPFLVNGQQESNLVLQTKLSVRLTDLPVADVLDTISRQTGYFFSYDPVLVQANRKISISFSETSLEKVLNAIFKGSLTYKVLQDQIIIRKEQKAVLPDTMAVGPPDSHIILSGKILDLETSAPIPYASVSLWNQPVGTISNRDGEFDLKLPKEKSSDTLIFSCLAYQKYLLPITDFEFEKNNIFLRPVSIRIKEIKVKAIAAIDVIHELLSKISENYPSEPCLMTSFYRETLQQDGKYINVSEAVMEILKTSYKNRYSEDRSRIVRGRKNNQEPLFKWVDFKMQGGPYYITLLDIVKTQDSFLNSESLDLYKYEIDEVVFFRDRPTYVISFKPSVKSEQSVYQGKLYVDRETSALVQATFGYDKPGLKIARESMIKKKPKGFNVRPEEVSYQVSYKNDNGKWFFNTAKAQIEFKVKSRDDKINSFYTSISDLLVTDYTTTNVKRFKHTESFHPDDIFTELIVDFDEEFWGSYNTIKPDEDLRKALRSEQKNKSK
ncbi:MAG: STN and carboxypeptidase regulatory-like domain-containing protein [Prolixibacteraceae bacterium]|jgi:hypothetical protein|nr:STN and carboxypeptidase regulatory-like domain-containing protein [Prolixibacteraceae bacterium]